ncbi:hypothetical protein [Actinophytocola glycyrrhizae]|uniref:DUF4304 domain-containing protein n=1 Tax=Actinophytocola glycyrrhizae TaxID=2044873 RepID=A0ABV9S7L2_9PSEU
MDPRTKLLDELVEQYLTPIMKAAGFRKSGKRRWLAGQAPDNMILLDMRPHQSDVHQVGFFVEWSVIPAAVLDYRNRNSPKVRRPDITWGILSDRVVVSPEIAVSFNIDGDETRWMFSMSDGIDECGAALRRLLSDDGLLDRLLQMRDRQHLLQVLDMKSQTRLPAGTPPGWPWRYLAMYINDGDLELLDSMLAPLEEKYPEPDLATPSRQRYYEFLVWLRQRLNARLAELRN